jgi:hypothetical protein
MTSSRSRRDGSADPTINRLVELGRRLRDEIDLYEIEDQLQSTAIDDRMDSALFSLSHLLYSGAVAESQIVACLDSGEVPDPVASHPDFSDVDAFATMLAWQGTAFGNVRNIIGSLSFLVVLLFFFEGFAKLVIERLGQQVPYNASAVVDWLRSNSSIPITRLDAIEFLHEYRNAWHAFGVHGATKPPIPWRNLTLEPGKRIPVPQPDERMDLVAEVVEAVLAVNQLRP